jgi:hypothetical protein
MFMKTWRPPLFIFGKNCQGQSGPIKCFPQKGRAAFADDQKSFYSCGYYNRIMNFIYSALQ